MSYEYKCAPVMDVFIYSGVVPNLEKKFDQENALLQKGTSVYQEAFANYQKAFEKHRVELKFDLHAFVSLVGRNISVIKEAGSENVSVVANKLRDLADTQMKTEKTWNGLKLFFHRLGHVFKGHGFRTEGEWAKEFANKLQSGVAKEVLKPVKEAFMKAAQISGTKIPQQHVSLINQMDKKAFKEVIAAYVSGQVPQGLQNPYSDFYRNLNQEKQQWLMEAILAQPSWPAQVVKLGIKEEFTEETTWQLVKPSPEMIKKVQGEPALLFNEYEKKDNSQYYKRAAKPLLEWAVIDFINKQDALGVRRFIDQTEGRIGCIRQLLENPEHLKQEHVNWLKDNFNLNM